MRRVSGIQGSKMTLLKSVAVSVEEQTIKNGVHKEANIKSSNKNMLGRSV